MQFCFLPVYLPFNKFIPKLIKQEASFLKHYINNVFKFL